MIHEFVNLQVWASQRPRERKGWGFQRLSQVDECGKCCWRPAGSSESHECTPRPRETACIKCKQASALRKGVVTYQRRHKMEHLPEIHQRQLPEVGGQQLPQGPGPEDYKEWRPGH